MYNKTFRLLFKVLTFAYSKYKELLVNKKIIILNINCSSTFALCSQSVKYGLSVWVDRVSSMACLCVLTEYQVCPVYVC